MHTTGPLQVVVTTLKLIHYPDYDTVDKLMTVVDNARQGGERGRTGNDSN